MASVDTYVAIAVITFFLILLVFTGQWILERVGRSQKASSQKRKRPVRPFFLRLFQSSGEERPLLEELHRHQELMRELKKASFGREASTKEISSSNQERQVHKKMLSPDQHKTQAPYRREDITEEISFYGEDDFLPRQWFRCHDGTVAKNRGELVRAVGNMDAKTFTSHVHGEKNDIAQWVETVLGDAMLASAIRKRPTKERTFMLLKGKWAA